MDVGLEYIIGKPGSGKTSYVVATTVDEDLKYFNYRYYQFKDYIDFHNRTHTTKLTPPPQHHIVSSDFDIYTTLPSMQTYPISGFEFGKPNSFQKTKRLMRFGVYIFDEIARYWPSKQNFTLPPWVTELFELRRHIGLKIRLIAQKLTKLHPDIRAVVDVFTLIEKSIHTFEINGKRTKSKMFLEGRLIQTVFYGVHFTEEAQVVKYLDGDHSLGEKFTYTHHGDVRENYNPYNFADELDVDAENDFENKDYKVDENFEYNEIKIRKRPSEWDNYKKLAKKLEEKVEEAS